MPIPDDEVWPDHQHLTVGPPRGHDPTGDIRSADMMAAVVELNGESLPAYTARIALDPGDLERLAAGEPFYLTLYGVVVPFDVAMTDTEQV